MSEQQTLSDENLKQFITEEQITDMQTLFSAGKFYNILLKYFKIIDANTPDTPAPNIMFSNAPQKFELNLSLVDKFEQDKLTQQILLTILIYCLLKNNRTDDVKKIITKYNFEKEIFSFIMLKSKYYVKMKNIPKAIDILSRAMNSYNNYKKNEAELKNDSQNIITIETYNQKFTYFQNLFNFLFGLNNIDIKIKKLYFELKICLHSLKFFTQSYKLIIELHEKYPDDIQIIFELCRDSIMFSKFDKYQEMLSLLEKKRDTETDEKKKSIINNYILYAQSLNLLSQGKYDETQQIYSNILKNDVGNPIILNNFSLINVFKNNIKECYGSLIQLIGRGNESYNDSIRNNLNVLCDKFNLPK